MSLETCCECDAETGRAGVGEDSLHAGDKGPYCEDCWSDLPEEFADKIARLTAELIRHSKDRASLRHELYAAHALLGEWSDIPAENNAYADLRARTSELLDR